MTINDTIVRIAESYIGKTEKKANSGFNDPVFEQKMKAVGWYKGAAWCSYFAELVWKEAYTGNTPIFSAIDKLCSASAVGTFANYSGSKHFTVSKTVPVKGAIVIWKHGDSWQGHAGIVTAMDLQKNLFITVEGNTDHLGGREGYEVASKVRRITTDFNPNGLNLLGFIYPA